MIKLLLLLIISCHIWLIFHTQFTAWPELLTYPYLLNSHFRLYSDFVVPYPPLVIFSLSTLFTFVPYTALSLKLFVAVWLVCTDLVLFRLLRRVSSATTSLVLLGLYITLQITLEGNMFWFDLALILPLLVCFLFLTPRHYLLSGLFLAIALFSKQSAIFYFLFLVPYVYYTTTSIIKTVLFLLPTGLFALFFTLYLILTASFSAFINWALIYPFIYWSHNPFYLQPFPSHSQSLTLILLLSPLLLLKFPRHILLAGFVAMGLLATYPRFSFFHFQPVLPFIVLGMASLRIRKIGLLFLAGVTLRLAYPTLSYSFNLPDRFLAPSDLAQARAIAAVTSPADRLFLLNFPSNYYVLANRLPPKPWLDNFSWYYEVPGVAQAVVAAFQAHPPAVIFISPPQPGPFLAPGTYMPPQLISFIHTNYTRAAIGGKIELWTLSPH